MELEQRVKRLERQNRFFKLFFLAMFLFFTMAAAEEIVCIPLASESFTLVDAKNRKTAELKNTPSGPVLRMFDGRGNKRAAIGIVSSGRNYRPAIGFFDKNENILGHVRLGRDMPHFNDPKFMPGMGDPRRL